MINLIESVYGVSEDFLNVNPMPSHARLMRNGIQDLAKRMTDEGIVNFYDKEPQEVLTKDEIDELEDGGFDTKEKWFSDEDLLHLIVRELVAASINYCYWYGASMIRPMGASSTTMYNAVDSALQFFSQETFPGHIEHLVQELALQRFPLLEERKRHLYELLEDGKGITFARYVIINKNNPENVFRELVQNFPGFASDIFLKRASLFMIQLYRQLNWFEDFMSDLFVPADYQVPKMLWTFKAIEYSNVLQLKIQESKLIEKGSLMECQLRAATIQAVKKLHELTGWNIADIDTWLWTKRKEPVDPRFHLTITTDY